MATDLGRLTLGDGFLTGFLEGLGHCLPLLMDNPREEDAGSNIFKV